MTNTTYDKLIGCARVCAIVLAAGLLVALPLLTGCGPKGEDQREADRLVYHEESPGERAGSTTATAVPAGPEAPAQAPVTTVIASPEEDREVERAGESVTPAVRTERVSYAEAEGLYQERRYHEAADLFTAYTEQNPDNSWGFYMLGLSHWKAGRLDRAEIALVTAAEMDPSHLKTRINLARVLLEGGQHQDALVVAREAAELHPGSGEVQRMLGRAYHNLGMPNEAIAAYREAVAIDGRDVWAMNNLGLIHIEAQRFDDALPPLARAVELRTDVAVFWNNLGIALERTGNYATATEAYRAALESDASYGRAADNLARIEGIPNDPGRTYPSLAALARRFERDLAGRVHETSGDDVTATRVTPAP